jgi:hypothetical protein
MKEFAAAMRANGSNSSGISSVILGMVVIALAGMVGTIGLLRQVGELGPKVGDIVSFDPLEAFSHDMRSRVAATPAGAKPGSACILDVRAMHAVGGSVVIEAKDPDAPTVYRVHWAGARSSDDRADCGASADLLLNRDDIEVLAMAAGGYGVSAKRLAANMLWSVRTSEE